MSEQSKIKFYKRWWFILPVGIVAAYVLTMLVWNSVGSYERRASLSDMRVLWQFSIASDTPSVAQVQTFFRNTLNASSAIVPYNSGADVFSVLLPAMSEAQHQSYIVQLKAQYPSFFELAFRPYLPNP